MKISFTGDIVFWGYFSDMENDPNVVDSDIVAYLNKSDCCVCDIEGPVYSGKTTIEKVAIRSKPTIVNFTKKINGNIWCLGNNHIFDYGLKGMQETIDVAEKNGILTFGAGTNISEASRPILLDTLVGLLSIRYYNKHNKATESDMGCLIWDDDATIKNKIKEIKEKCKWCVLVIHGGDEFCDMPLPDIRKRYYRFLEWGADVIVGHHPHVIQNYEKVGDKMIFYSLGNFIFDDEYMRIQPESKNGILLTLDFTNDEFLWNFMPIYIDGDNKRVIHSEAPAIFREIGEAEYKSLLPSLKKTFKKRERKNLAFCLKRKIKFHARLRITISHLLRYLKIENRFKQ